MISRIFRIFLTAVGCLVGTSVLGNPIQIPEGYLSLKLTEGIRYHVSDSPVRIENYEDLGNIQWRFNEKDAFSIGYSKATVLTHIPLEFTNVENGLYYLTIDFPSLDRIDFSVYDSITGDRVYHFLTGDRFPFRQRPIIQEVFVFPIERIATQKRLDIVISTQTSGSHKLPFILETPDAYQERITKKYFVWGLFLGLIFTFFLLSLVFLFFTRHTAILFFSLYAFSLLWLFLSGFGLGYRFIFPDSDGVQNNLFIIASSVSVSLKIFFYIQFLRTKTTFPKFYAYLLILVGIFFLSTFGYIVSGMTELYSIVLSLGPVTIFSLILLSYISMKFESNSKYFLLAELVLFVGVLVSSLAMMGLVSHNAFTYQIFLWSVGVEILILSIAIGRMIYGIKLEKDSAQAATTAKGIFLTTMSHEIRTPLNGVLGFLDLLDYTELDETQKEYVSIARHSGKSLLYLLNDILDYSKIEAGRLELFLEKSSLSAIVKESMQIVKPMALKKQLKLSSTIQNAPEFIYVDPSRLKQVLINLLGNAVKFTDHGSVSIEISFQKLGLETGNLHFRVIDTGTGIKSSEIEKLFQVFTQVDSNHKKRHEGTGLGLAISDSLVRRMGGKIEVKSIFGQGSEFFFTLPVQYWQE